jgi:hypothetical protein
VGVQHGVNVYLQFLYKALEIFSESLHDSLRHFGAMREILIRKPIPQVTQEVTKFMAFNDIDRLREYNKNRERQVR